MPGYANKRICIPFPDMTEDGEPEIHLIIKNPKLVPLDELQPPDVNVGPNGQVDEASARPAMYKVIARLILAGRVYDATNFDEDQRPMTLPMTADDVARLPWEIVKKVTEMVTEVMNPS